MSTITRHGHIETIIRFRDGVRPRQSRILGGMCYVWSCESEDGTIEMHDGIVGTLQRLSCMGEFSPNRYDPVLFVFCYNNYLFGEAR